MLGRIASTEAMANRCFSPVESVFTVLSLRCPMPVASSARFQCELAAFSYLIARETKIARAESHFFLNREAEKLRGRILENQSDVGCQLRYSMFSCVQPCHTHRP